MDHMRRIRIFLSSPGDLSQERTLAQTVIDALNHDPLVRDQVVLRAVAWDKRDSRAPMMATLTPQEALKQGLPHPAECDIVVVILWSRMGTPLPAEYTKPDGGRYQSGTEYEYLDARNGAKASKERGDHPIRPQILIYRRTEKVTFDPDDAKFEEKVEQRRRVQDFFKQFTAPDGSLVGGVNDYVTPDDFRADFENDLKFLLKDLMHAPAPTSTSTSAASTPTATTTPPPPEPPAPERWRGSPFPGLRAFIPDDAPIFFGRGRETDALISRFADGACRFVCVVGASGSGKSSVVGAGLIPRLLANGIEGSKDWAWLRFTPAYVGDNPFMALAAELIATFGPLKRAYAQPRPLADALEKDPDALAKNVTLALSDGPAWAELLLFVDQFEELFTLTAERYRGAFAALLHRAARTPRLRVIATLRADFYHRCVEVGPLAELLQNGSYPLAAPKPATLREMIARPADRASLTFDEGLIDQMLDDTGSDPGALALMAYALDELYRTADADQSRRLTRDAYDRLGGVQGAIGTRAGAVFGALDQETQTALQQVFHNLVEVDERGVATRQRAALARIADDAESPEGRLVAALTEARLLVQSRGEGGYPVVEVAHEALLRNWPTLARWIEDTQDDLRLLRQVRLAADEWDAEGRRAYLLWPQERLKLVYAMQARLSPDLTETERDFIEPEAERLLRELEDLKTTHKRRFDIGDRLSVIGDPRPGLGVLPDGTPDIAWCLVEPGGQLTLTQKGKRPSSSSPFSQKAQSNALPKSSSPFGKRNDEPEPEPEPDKDITFTIQPFYIAKYLITYAQFQAFVEAEDGHADPRWWEGMPEKYQHQAVNNPPSQQANYPRASVSWYQAVAFSKWAHFRVEQLGLLPLTPNPSPTRRGEGNQTGGGELGDGGRARWEILPALAAKMTDVARRLRQESTPSEDLLWEVLRGRKLDGRKFRRQEPVGPFVLDFYCASERLAVEVDGPIHDQQQEADAARQALLEALGIRFVRVSAALVEYRRPEAIALIRASFTTQADSPPPVRFPSPLLVGEGLGVRDSYTLRLPAEWEWQWAAQGGSEQREYPWGAWDNQPRANTTEAGINDRSTAVGMYPSGIARCEALDLAGNLFEWCLNRHDDIPYHNIDESGDTRVLRGGSFRSRRFNAATAARGRSHPNLDYHDYGCRLVVAPNESLISASSDL